MENNEQGNPPSEEVSPALDDTAFEAAKADRAKDTRKGAVIGIFVGISLQLFAFFLGHRSIWDFGEPEGSLGLALFMAAPLVSGFALGIIMRHRATLRAYQWIIIVSPLGILLFTGLEGIICCFMAFPLVAISVGIGVVAGRWLGNFLKDRTPTLLVILCPLLIAAADSAERPYRSIERIEDITSEIVINANPQNVWNSLERMDRLDGPRPLLLKLGLPVPTHCELDHDGVGGKRICHFKEGHIAQEITEWNEPTRMGVRITEATLPGRHWLTYFDAGYELHQEREQTRLVRHTRIGTKLYPRWYWRPLETWGVTSEHAFVFMNVKRNAEGRSSVE